MTGVTWNDSRQKINDHVIKNLIMPTAEYSRKFGALIPMEPWETAQVTCS